MRPLRVPFESLSQGRIVLDDAASRYVARVHRVGVGGQLVLFDPEARAEAQATVVETGRRVVCEVAALRPATHVPRTELTLVQALGKGDKPEEVVRAATALSATRVIFVEAARSVVRGAWSAEKRRRFRAVAVEAARQSGRGDVPDIEGPMPLADAPNGVASLEARVCLAPGAGKSFGALLSECRPGASVALFVGPEGGFDDGELRALESAGVTLASFGDLALRTELAAAAALGAVIASRR